MAGTNGSKFPTIREHLNAVIGQHYTGLETSFTSFPADDVPRDAEAWLSALDQVSIPVTIEYDASSGLPIELT